MSTVVNVHRCYRTTLLSKSRTGCTLRGPFKSLWTRPDIGQVNSCEESRHGHSLTVFSKTREWGSKNWVTPGRCLETSGRGWVTGVGRHDHRCVSDLRSQPSWQRGSKAHSTVPRSIFFVYTITTPVSFRRHGKVLMSRRNSRRKPIVCPCVFPFK